MCLLFFMSVCCCLNERVCVCVSVSACVFCIVCNKFADIGQFYYLFDLAIVTVCGLRDSLRYLHRFQKCSFLSNVCLAAASLPHSQLLPSSVALVLRVRWPRPFAQLTWPLFKCRCFDLYLNAFLKHLHISALRGWLKK